MQCAKANGDAEPAAESGEKSDTPEEDAFIETEISMHDARRADIVVSVLADDSEHCFKMHVAFLENFGVDERHALEAHRVETNTHEIDEAPVIEVDFDGLLAV